MFGEEDDIWLCVLYVLVYDNVWLSLIWYKVDRCLARYSPRAQTDLPNQLISEPVIGHIWAEMVPNWKTERNQSCLRIWGSYDPIECSPSEPQKWVLQGVAWKKGKFWAKNGPCRPPEARHAMSQHKTVVFLVSCHNGNNFFGWCLWKMSFRPKNSIFDPKKATLGNRGCKTARRAAKRPPTQKLKVSRVTSGYGGDMIPSIRVRPSPKKGGCMGVA